MNIQSIGDTLGLKPKTFSLDHIKELHIALLGSHEALSYLEGRGLSKDTIQNFLLGYDEEKKAISIPSFKRGEVVAIKYRYINPDDDKKRYYQEKGGQNWVFNENGIDLGRSKGAVLIVEGEFDCMSAWQVGVKNVISVGGAEAVGQWIELLDSVPKIYLGYDNDEAGKKGAKKFAERLGTDKCFEVLIPEKDLNEFFNKHTREDFNNLIREAKPFYKYEFSGIEDIITSMRSVQDEVITLEHIPNVRFEKDWLAMISGQSNVGKTAFCLNLATELTNKGIPTLILPFERGIESVGKRFLQVKFNKTADDFTRSNNDEWDDIIADCIKTPVYFAMPKRGEIIETIVKSKKLFDTRVVIVDHLDYVIRNVQGNKEAEIANTLQALKRVAEENKILMLIVTHVRKQEGGSMLQRDPKMEDLKGSSSLYQDPECVVMLSRQDENKLKVNVLKNKGDMGSAVYDFNFSTGKLSTKIDEFSGFQIES